MHDYIIRGGTVVDGTGAAGLRADVAIDGDVIVRIADLSGVAAKNEIDATGLVVTPGFVDLHTHLDAQIGWDPLMTSSSWQGVTTVLTGNCGVTFAPVAPQNRSYLAEMMESVEDIPRDAILNGIPWDWETFPQYLDSVQRMEPALNVVGLVGHCAIRYHVMGERSLTDEMPTATELEEIRRISEESIAGGAVGFSTSRILLHKVPDGRLVPGTLAPVEEYLAVADGMNDAGGGLFQAVPDFLTKFPSEIELLTTMAEKCGDVIFSTGVGNGEGKATEFWGSYLSKARRDVGRITGLSMTRPSGSLMGLHQVPPVGGKEWRAFMNLPSTEEKLAALKNATSRAALVAEGKERGLWYDPQFIYPLGNGAVPDYSVDGGDSVAVHAERAGLHPVEWMIDRLIESDGRELFNVWFFNRNTAEMPGFFNLDGILPSLSDAGAHAGQICDADSSTHFLSYWCLNRKITELPAAIKKLTQDPAQILGLKKRGVLAEGHFADINVFDPATLNVGYPEYVKDFPNGKGRLRVGATGYAITMVNGHVVTANGSNTGARPGRVIREFAR